MRNTKRHPHWTTLTADRRRHFWQHSTPALPPYTSLESNTSLESKDSKDGVLESVKFKSTTLICCCYSEKTAKDLVTELREIETLQGAEISQTGSIVTVSEPKLSYISPSNIWFILKNDRNFCQQKTVENLINTIKRHIIGTSDALSTPAPAPVR